MSDDKREYLNAGSDAGSDEGPQRNLMDYALDRPRETKFCLGFLVFIGGVLLIIGAIFLITAPFNERDENVSRYNKVVNSWSTTYQEEFSGLNFYVNYTGRGWVFPLNNTDDVLLSADTESDVIRDSKTGELDVYKALKYRYTFPQAFPATGPEWIRGKSGGTDFQAVYLPGNPAPLIEFPRLYVKRTTADPTTCHAKGGTYDDREEHCRYHYQATSVCVQVKPNDFGGWELSTEDPGPGCHYKDVVPTEFYPVKFKMVKAGAEGKEPGGYLSLDLEFTIRSNHDPWITLQDLSHGTLSFGSNAGAAVGTGVFLALFGVVMLVPSIWFAVVFRRRLKSEHHLPSTAQTGIVYVATPPRKSDKGRERVGAGSQMTHSPLMLDGGIGPIEEEFVYTPPPATVSGERDVI